VIVRVGIPEPNGHLVDVAHHNALPVLISAGALWDKARGRFGPPGLMVWRCCDVALDSAGFTAMKHWGGYPWTVDQYVDAVNLGRSGVRDDRGELPIPWTWWSQMDLCCEPEIASDRATVRARVEGTARLLAECREAVDAWRWEGDRELAYPMPVLQGWHPDDYRRSIDLADAVLGGDWPDLVGVGSVCRRQLGGPAGLWRVLDAIEGALPSHVKLHLFGVKSEALEQVGERVASVDSMAWDLAARLNKGGAPSSVVTRGEAMIAWAQRQGQRRPGPQISLWGG
jgi:hypothetical protein